MLNWLKKIGKNVTNGTVGAVFSVLAGICVIVVGVSVAILAITGIDVSKTMNAASSGKAAVMS